MNRASWSTWYIVFNKTIEIQSKEHQKTGERRYNTIAIQEKAIATQSKDHNKTRQHNTRQHTTRQHKKATQDNTNQGNKQDKTTTRPHNTKQNTKQHHNSDWPRFFFQDFFFIFSEYSDQFTFQCSCRVELSACQNIGATG